MRVRVRARARARARLGVRVGVRVRVRVSTNLYCASVDGTIFWRRLSASSKWWAAPR